MWSKGFLKCYLKRVDCSAEGFGHAESGNLTARQPWPRTSLRGLTREDILATEDFHVVALLGLVLSLFDFPYSALLLPSEVCGGSCVVVFVPGNHLWGLGREMVMPSKWQWVWLLRQGLCAPWSWLWVVLDVMHNFVELEDTQKKPAPCRRGLKHPAAGWAGFGNYHSTCRCSGRALHCQSWCFSNTLNTLYLHNRWKLYHSPDVTPCGTKSSSASCWVVPLALQLMDWKKAGKKNAFPHEIKVCAFPSPQFLLDVEI